MGVWREKEFASPPLATTFPDAVTCPLDPSSVNRVDPPMNGKPMRPVVAFPLSLTARLAFCTLGPCHSWPTRTRQPNPASSLPVWAGTNETT